MFSRGINVSLEEAVSEISVLSQASMGGSVMIPFRKRLFVLGYSIEPSSFIEQFTASGAVVAQALKEVKIPFLSEEHHRVVLLPAYSLDGVVRVRRVKHRNHVAFTIRGNIEDKFHRSWRNLLHGTHYNYQYDVKAGFVTNGLPVPAYQP